MRYEKTSMDPSLWTSIDPKGSGLSSTMNYLLYDMHRGQQYHESFQLVYTQNLTSCPPAPIRIWCQQQ